MAQQDKSAKDKQMAARLKAEGNERWTGRCAICRAIIRNGKAIRKNKKRGS